MRWLILSLSKLVHVFLICSSGTSTLTLLRVTDFEFPRISTHYLGLSQIDLLRLMVLLKWLILSFVRAQQAINFLFLFNDVEMRAFLEKFSSNLILNLHLG